MEEKTKRSNVKIIASCFLGTVSGFVMSMCFLWLSLIITLVGTGWMLYQGAFTTIPLTFAMQFFSNKKDFDIFKRCYKFVFYAVISLGLIVVMLMTLGTATIIPCSYLVYFQTSGPGTTTIYPH